MADFELPFVTRRRPWVGFTGYQSDPKKWTQSELTPPSINCMIDEAGKANQRFGFMEETGIDLGSAGNPAKPFYLSKYDVTIFAVGTSLKYYDWTTQVVYDTGITLTAGTITRGDAYMGDFYCSNVTDGLQRIVFGRINGNASASATQLGVDSDFAARLAVFGHTSGNVRINGTNEAFSSPSGSVSGAIDNTAGLPPGSGHLIRITTSSSHGLSTGDSVTITGVTGTTEANGTWKINVIDATNYDLQGSTFTNGYVSGGTWTFSPVLGGTLHTTALTQSYLDNAIVVYTENLADGREKASKVFFWKSRMGLIGSQIANNADAPNATEYFGKFATPDNLQDIIDFTYGSGGSTKEYVGNQGRVTNAVPVKDYLYSFNEDEGYACAANDVVDSGTAIGESTPELKDEVHGCLNEDSACVIGNNVVSYITSDNRIMVIRVATPSGAPVVYPDESFDIPIKEHLKNMDKDQTGACAFYHAGKHRSIYQIKIIGQWYWFVFDWTINAWQPPQQVLFAQGFFERKGILYATDGTDDTVYSIDTAFDDNQVPINCIIATCDFDVGSVNLTKASWQGEISEAAMVRLQAFVTNNSGGRQGGSEKIIDGSTFTFDPSHGIGADPIGDSGDVQNTELTTEWMKEFDVYPSEANRCQLIVSNDNGGFFSVYKFTLQGNEAAPFANSL